MDIVQLPPTSQSFQHSSARVPVALLILATLLAGAAGALLGPVLVSMLGWPEAADGARAACVRGAGVVVVVGVLAALAMRVYAAGDASRVPQALLAGTGIRLLGVLFGGLAMSLVTDPDRPMWIGLLVAGLAALVLDTFVMMRAMGAGSAPRTHAGAASSAGPLA